MSQSPTSNIGNNSQAPPAPVQQNANQAETAPADKPESKNAPTMSAATPVPHRAAITATSVGDHDEKTEAENSFSAPSKKGESQPPSELKKEETPAQSTSENFKKPPETKPTSETEKKATSETEKKATSETEKKATSETEKKATSETEKKATSETEKKATSETEKKAASETEKKPTSESPKKPTSESPKKPTSESPKKPRLGCCLL